MKQFCAVALLVLSLSACGNSSSKNKSTENTTTSVAVQAINPSTVYVYYFHGKQRCKTCMEVEKVAKQTIEDTYANNSNVKFIEVNTSDKQNNALVEKYEVSWNALIIAKGNSSIDITEQAFANAVNKPEVMVDLIKNEVNKKLN